MGRMAGVCCCSAARLLLYKPSTMGTTGIVAGHTTLLLVTQHSKNCGSWSTQYLQIKVTQRSSVVCCKPSAALLMAALWVCATGGERSGLFKNSPLSDATVFDMDHVWTFHIHQHMVDLSSFTLYVLKQFDITYYLDGQPLQSMIKDR